MIIDVCMTLWNTIYRKKVNHPLLLICILSCGLLVAGSLLLPLVLQLQQQKASPSLSVRTIQSIEIERLPPSPTTTLVPSPTPTLTPIPTNAPVVDTSPVVPPQDTVSNWYLPEMPVFTATEVVPTVTMTPVSSVTPEPTLTVTVTPVETSIVEVPSPTVTIEPSATPTSTEQINFPPTQSTVPPLIVPPLYP